MVLLTISSVLLFSRLFLSSVILVVRLVCLVVNWRVWVESLSGELGMALFVNNHLCACFQAIVLVFLLFRVLICHSVYINYNLHSCLCERMCCECVCVCVCMCGNRDRD